MIIRARNNEYDVNNAVDIEVDGHRSTVRIPDRRPGQFHAIYWDGENFWVTPDLKRRDDMLLVSAWGTAPREMGLMQMQQDGPMFEFSGDFDFDQDYGQLRNGDGLWKYRGNYGGWPPGLARAIWVRGECGRRRGTGRGISQINFAARCEEGTNRRPSMSFPAQVKGESEEGNANAVATIRVIIDQTQNQLGVMINDRSIAIYLNSGFELAI
jgi:hypothetical protein